MARGSFLALSAAASAATLLPGCATLGSGRRQPRIPRWRGFNLTEMNGPRRGHPYKESDFEWMQGWGFNFARLPLSYWQWSTTKDWMTIDPAALEPLDRALELGRQYGVHVSM